MNVNISSKEFALMQRYIEEECGISIGNDKAYLIESRLSSMLGEFNCSSYEELYHLIYTKKDRRVSERVIDAITTNETLWFRDKTPWIILEKVLLPQYIKDLESGKRDRIRIWSAGCSTGQEPYSTAMVIHNFLDIRGLKEKFLPKFEIVATDISSTVLEVAKKGRYDSISIMRGMPASYRDKYFKREGRVWILDDEIRNMVDFRQFNLQNSFVLLGKFHIIFCRYVMIYFSSDLKDELVSKFSMALKDSGILFIGSSEMLSVYREYFDMEQYEGGVYYRKKGEVL